MLSTSPIGAIPFSPPVAPARPAAAPPVAGSTAAEASFGSILASLSSDTINALKAGETAAVAGIQGKAAIQDVVHTVMSAEQTLQAAIAIRDKVVAAYLEISRMQI